MFESAYRFAFDGGHDVINPHVHRFSVQVECAGEVADTGPTRGMVVDFALLARICQTEVRRRYDGAMLLEAGTLVDDADLPAGLRAVEVGFRPTVEGMARHVHELITAALPDDQAAKVRRIVIWENERCMAAFAPETA